MEEISTDRVLLLIDPQELRLASQAKLVGGLWKQARDHLAQLGAIQARLESGDGGDIGRPLESGDGLGELYSAVAGRIEHRLLASLLVGEAQAAEERGLALELDPGSRLRRLPVAVEEAAAVSIVGNLVGNALDAVAAAPPERRRVSVLLSDAEGGMRVRVRDWGRGLAQVSHRELLSPGFTTKPGHSGVGLAIVRDLVETAGGRLTIERLDPGTAFEVDVPCG